MSNLKLPDVTDLDSARAFLGDRQRARLGHNTTIRRGLGGDVIVTYHETDIVTYCGDGTIILKADGWVSATTANRLHKLTPATVCVGRKLGDYVITIMPAPRDWDNGERHTWDGHGIFQIVTI